MKTELVKKREEMQRRIKHVIDDFNRENDDHYVYDLILRTTTNTLTRSSQKVVVATEVEVKIMLR